MAKVLKMLYHKVNGETMASSILSNKMESTVISIWVMKVTYTLLPSAKKAAANSMSISTAW